MSKSIQLKDKDNIKMYPHPYYPVGSIYLSVNNTNPSTWFGGTWEQIAKGRTLVGVDTNDGDFNTVKKTGGSKYIQEHKHGFKVVKDNATNSGGSLPKANNSQGDNSGWTGFYSRNDGNLAIGTVVGATTGNSGNLQPYFTCYIWCRTA